MNRVKGIEDNFPHEVSEVICVKCGKRWISVRPENVLLKELECPNCGVGYVINTGQSLTSDFSLCTKCNKFENNRCKLKLSRNNEDIDCAYYFERK